MSAQLRRMDDVEHWRQKAYMFSRSDRLGNLVMKSFDLVQTVQRDGIFAENLSWNVKSLARERVRTINDDQNRDDEMRTLMYGMSASIGSMIESIIESSDEVKDESETQMDPIDANSNLLNISYDNYLQTGSVLPHYEVVKPEPMEDAMDIVAENDSTEVMVEPLDDEDPGANKQLAPSPIERTTSNETEESSTTTVAAAATTTVSHTSIRCQVCGTKVKDLRSLEIHTKIRHPGKNEASKKKDNEERASSPLVTDETDASRKKFSCSQCSQRFATTKALKYHENVHKGVKCAECGRMMKNNANLLKHFEEKHPGVKVRVEENRGSDGDWSQKCAQCGVKTHGRAHFERHMRVHTGEKPFSCSHCPTTFVYSFNLKRHIREKHGEKPFECIPCGEKFAKRNELYEHNLASNHTSKRNSV